VSGQSLGEEGREQAAHQSGALNALSSIRVHREGIYKELLSVLQGISKLMLSMLHFLLSMLHSYISMPQVKLYVHEDILSKITPFSLGMYNKGRLLYVESILHYSLEGDVT
jgi:hypothetical protein